MNVKIAIAAHKKYQMPDDSIYLPMHVGATGKEGIGFERDDSGDNISEKNPYYCELTGVYWLWKNVKADYYGLTHYRRHFSAKKGFKPGKDKFKYVLNAEQLEKLLRNNNILVPKKRKYYIENLYNHYAHTHYAEHLDITREIIKEKCPEYVSAFDVVMKRTWAHMFNMFIMRREYYNEYCEWLFSILFELENRTDPTKYNAFQARYFGRVSELLFDVWLLKNQYEYKEIPTINMEKLDWGRKIRSFIRSKFSGKKYDSSF